MKPRIKRLALQKISNAKRRSRRAKKATRTATSGSPWLVSLEAPAPKEDGETPRRSLFGIGLKYYLKLVDAMSRKPRPGEPGAVLADAAPILKRIGVDLESWTERVLIASVKAIDDWWGTAIGDKPSLAVEAARRGKARVVDPIRRKKKR